MLTRAKAIELVRQRVSREIPDAPVQIDELTGVIGVEWGWVVCYESADPHQPLAGNAPFFFVRETSEYAVLGSTFGLQAQIEAVSLCLDRRSAAWGLAIDHTILDAPQLTALRAAWAVSYKEILELNRRLPGVVWRGARTDLQPLASAASEVRISARVIPIAEPFTDVPRFAIKRPGGFAPVVELRPISELLVP